MLLDRELCDAHRRIFFHWQPILMGAYPDSICKDRKCSKDCPIINEPRVPPTPSEVAQYSVNEMVDSLTWEDKLHMLKVLKFYSIIVGEQDNEHMKEVDEEITKLEETHGI